MIRNQILLTLFSILVCISTDIYAQEDILLDDINTRETSTLLVQNSSAIRLTGNVYNNCQEEIKHSQKTLTWSNGYGGESDARYYSLTLSRFRCEDKELSKFIAHYESPAIPSYSNGDYLFEDGNYMNIFIFPDTMTIYDVKVFDDIIYFCGRIISRNHYDIGQVSPNLLQYEQYDTSGVVGWIDVNSLFSDYNNNQYNNDIPFSYVKSGYTFTKLRTFKDLNDNFTTKIAAMGTFRNASYTMATPITPTNPSTTWITMPPTYNDMVFIYNTSGTSSYVKSLNYTSIEKFQDIKLIGGDIAILSLMYDGVTTNHLYTPSGELLSDKVRYRTVQASNLAQTNSHFDIKWTDILTHQKYDTNVVKGIYNARLDYAGEFDGFYTNLNTSNNTGNLIGFGIDDDLPAYGYDNYASCKLPYQYNLVMSFNHYEARQEGPCYAVVMNWLSHRELIHAHNPNYMGAKCSARIYEGDVEWKLIDANRMIGDIYPRLTEQYVPNSINATAFSDFNVILEDEEEVDHIFVVHLDDHSGDGEYFWTNTLDTTSIRSENRYIVGGSRICYEISPNGIFEDSFKKKFSDINTIVGANKYFFRAVGNLDDVSPIKPIDFFQYTNSLFLGQPCYKVDAYRYNEKAYPVTINYQDEPDLNTYIYRRELKVEKNEVFPKSDKTAGSCNQDFLQTQ